MAQNQEVPWKLCELFRYHKTYSLKSEPGRFSDSLAVGCDRTINGVQVCGKHKGEVNGDREGYGKSSIGREDMELVLSIVERSDPVYILVAVMNRQFHP